MFIEWRTENSDVRPLLLYFSELYILRFGKECFFTKGNVTAARNIMTFCDEGQINPLRYIQLCFDGFTNNIKKTGFTFMSSRPYKNHVLNLILSPTYVRRYGTGTYTSSPPTIFDSLRPSVLKYAGNKYTKEEILRDLFTSVLPLEAFLFLIDSETIERLPEYDAIIKTLNEQVEDRRKKIKILMKRGVLPRTPEGFKIFATYLAWSQNNRTADDRL
jgi:hypothetical protein